MIDFSKLCEINSQIKPVDIRGKSYATVAQRIQAFRALLPAGRIETEFVHLDLEKGECVMRAKVFLGDCLLATGTAWEVRANSNINKTSFIENCESSCVGRALGNLGIGSFDSIASKEEVEQAEEQQSRFRAINGKEQKNLIDTLKEKGRSITEFADITHNASGWSQITAQMYGDIIRRLQDDEDSDRFAPGD